MTYRVFISTTQDEQSREYMEAVKMALWRMHEMPLAPVTNDDFITNTSFENPVETLKRVIDGADLFIGIYGEEYGAIPPGYDISHIEIEYNYAMEQGLQCLVFIPEHAYAAADAAPETPEQQMLRAFKRRLKESHVVHQFKSLDDLQSKVKLALANFKKYQDEGRTLKPGKQRFTSFGATPATAPDLETLVNDALTIAEPSLEALVTRGIELFYAQQAVQQERPTDEDGHMTVKPIFGQPATSSQFQADIFMIMPFRAEYNTIYENVIKPVAAELNLTIKRGDDFSSVTGLIMQEVWAAINACKLVIVETSEVNANVYYELGIAHTLGKPAVMITQADDVEELPFDLRHRRFIHYQNTISGGETLEAELKRSIIWILNDLEENQDDSQG